MNQNKVIPVILAAAGVMLAAVAIAGISQNRLMQEAKNTSISQSGKKVEPTYSRAGKPAPEFELTSLDGKKIRLSDFVGHPVLINYWATWCPPCREELPLIQKRFERFSPDLVVLTINGGEDIETVKDYVENNGYTFHILLDPEWKTESLYGVMAYPTSIFIDRNGVIQARYVGSISDSILDEYLGLIGVDE